MYVKGQRNVRNRVLKVRCDSGHTSHMTSLNITCHPVPHIVLRCDEDRHTTSSCVSFEGLYDTSTLTSNTTITCVVNDGSVDVSTWSTYVHIVHDSDERKLAYLVNVCDNAEHKKRLKRDKIWYCTHKIVKF